MKMLLAKFPDFIIIPSSKQYKKEDPMTREHFKDSNNENIAT